MELRAYDVVVSLSVGKSQNYQKLRINYVTATSCVSWGSQRSGMLVYLSLLLFYKNNVKRTCIAQLLFKSPCLACSKRHF